VSSKQARDSSNAFGAKRAYAADRQPVTRFRASRRKMTSPKPSTVCVAAQRALLDRREEAQRRVSLIRHYVTDGPRREFMTCGLDWDVSRAGVASGVR
jgi:hypothetical protein